MGQITPRVDLLLHTAKYGAHSAAVAGSYVGHDLLFVLCTTRWSKLDMAEIYILFKHWEIRC